MPLEVSERDGAVVFRLRVAPRAKKNAIGGEHGGALKIAVTAPPVDGAANTAIIALLAKALGVPKRDVEILRGASGKDKTVRVRRVTVDAVCKLGDGVQR